MDTSRVIICSPADVLLFELSPDEVWACDESIEINGPHTLEIVTTRVLTKEQRVLVFDEAEHAHEYVVASEDREHASGSIPYGTYKCAWSLQHDARLWKVDTDVGISTPVVASFALDAALSGTERWVRGSVTLVTTGGAEMHNMSGWEAFETIIATWGGEIDAEVTVGPTGVTARRVMLYAQMGNQTATRRFDYERDVESIQRHVLQDDVACRIIPLGKSEKNEYGFEHSVDIKSVNNGVEWLQNDDSAAIYRLAGPNGSYEYPIMYVENTEMETAADLLAWGQSVLEEYTVPKVEYEMEVTYLYHESFNPFGVSLGDVIQCVDHGFGDTPLRLEARVTGMTIDRLDRSRSTVKVSNVRENRSLTSALAGISSIVDEIVAVSGGITEYLNNLLDNINKEINARGGFVYITDGQGIRTYSDSVQDPLTGYEAGYVTEMKGGSLRFAHEKENGEWKWTTVITEQGYLGLAATIAQITSGLIQSRDGSNYWDLDSGEIRLTTGTYIGSGSTTIQDIIDAAGTTLTRDEIFNILTNGGTWQGFFTDPSSGEYYINAAYITSGVFGDPTGKSYWDTSNGRIVIVSSYKNFLNSADELRFDQITFTDSSGWLNTRTGQQTAVGVVLGNASNSAITGSGRLTLIPTLPEEVVNQSLPSNANLAAIISRNSLKLLSGNSMKSGISLTNYRIELNRINGSTVQKGIIIDDTGTYLMAVRTSYAGINTGYPYSYVAHIGTGGSGYSSSIISDFNGRVEFKDAVSIEGHLSYGSSSNRQDLYIYGDLTVHTGQKLTVKDELDVWGTKSRLVSTENYSDRLLYCYETSSPLFGDVGSAVIGDDGTCVISIDDIFQEAARTDMSYQVFLQKCGRGDLWVAAKTPTYFIVEGTDGLAFDWQIIAHQTGFETLRLEDVNRRDDVTSAGNIDISPLSAYDDDLPLDAETAYRFADETLYANELDLVNEIESLY